MGTSERRGPPPRTIAVEPFVDLPREFASDLPYAFGLGPDRQVWLAMSESPPAGRSEPRACRVLSYDGNGVRQLDRVIPDLPGDVICVQPLEEHLLLVTAAERHGDGSVSCDGHVHALTGEPVRRFPLGDIADAQATKQGEIWTSYHDQAVLGGGVASAGLNAWSCDGALEYRYEAPAGVQGILDCYALNVTSKDDVWLCYHTTFPLVRLHRREVVGVWPMPVRSGDAFAVDGHHALFCGGYGERHEYRLFELRNDGRALQRRVVSLTDRDGERIDAQRIAGRADALVFEWRGQLYRLRVSDLL